MEGKEASGWLPAQVARGGNPPQTDPGSSCRVLCSEPSAQPGSCDDIKSHHVHSCRVWSVSGAEDVQESAGSPGAHQAGPSDPRGLGLILNSDGPSGQQLPA